MAWRRRRGGLGTSFPRRSSDLTSAYALLVEPTEKYVNQKTHPQKHFVPGF